jgi:hypothetical protein
MGSIRVVRKKRGRPATGETAVSAIRLSGELRAKIDAWAQQQPAPMSRSEAIRTLVDRGLKRR